MNQSQRVERKLAAILAADVVGYSRLMGLDETGTLTRLKALRREFIEPRIAEHHGRTVKLMGDGALVEFASVVDAIACAVEIQRVAAAQGAGVPDDQRIAFRIGITLGDIIIDGDDIYGDGVNIAARVEGLSEPGGVVVTSAAYDQAKNKLDVEFESLGEHILKNIAEPVRVYRVRLDPTAAKAKKPPPRRWLVPGAAGALALLLVVAAAALWPWATSQRSPGGGLPTDKPSIAVLPFGNLSGDAEQAYFAEGLTDDIITDLSKISGLFVIARNSSAAYRDPSANMREVAEQLGVRYILEGSVRRSGDSVRINAQLIDGVSGSNVWAERYDRAYAEIFALQDEVIRQIVEALSVQLTATEQSQIARLPTRNLEAYDFYMRAEQKVYNLTFESLREALLLYERAVALDPDFADAYAGYARALVDVVSFGFQQVRLFAVARQQAYEAAGRALELNPQTPRAFAVLGILQALDGEHDEAVASVKKAVALDPNSADAQLNLAIVLIYAGQQPEALAAMERVLQLNPVPQSQVYDYYGLALFANNRYEEAIRAVRPTEDTVQSDLGLEVLAMAYARLDRTQEAHAAVDAILKRDPSANLNGLRSVYSHYGRPQDLDSRIDALRDAGVPEWPYDFRGRPEDRLDGAAIRALAVGKTWVGRQQTGSPFMMQISANGEYAQRGPQGLTSGRIAFEGDLMCMRSSAMALGRKFCSPVYRNPGGSSEKQDEYVFPDLASVWYFSVAP